MGAGVGDWITKLLGLAVGATVEGIGVGDDDGSAEGNIEGIVEGK